MSLSRSLVVCRFETNPGLCQLWGESKELFATKSAVFLIESAWGWESDCDAV